MIALGIGAAAGLSACLGVVLLRHRDTRAAPLPAGPTPAILMRNGVVVDVAPELSRVIPSIPHAGQDWTDAAAALAPLFPNLPPDLPEAAETISGNDGARLDISFGKTDGIVRLAVDKGFVGDALPEPNPADTLLDGIGRTILDSAPDPIWQMGADGRPQWFNGAYAQLCAEAGRDPHGPGPFTEAMANDATCAPRARIALTDGGQRWFALATRPSADGLIHFATPIDALVDAEMAQRTFVQTLTKTFAHLPIGLAVFDRDHRLVLFNPALVDLTRLPVDFLAARPNLMSFFDHMRENRMMPEPKNYTSWRQQLADVVCAARDDRYCETWNLASGLTYKITGRPHPDRAIAFLIEDISAEISLTRRFRSELELTQSVIDCFEEAVVVFSQLGVLTFCNTAYREMWKCDPDSAFAEVSINDATQDWQRACAPSPIWGDIRDFVVTLRERATWDATVTRTEGQRLICSVEPVAAGATMIRFKPEPAVAPISA